MLFEWGRGWELGLTWDFIKVGKYFYTGWANRELGLRSYNLKSFG